MFFWKRKKKEKDFDSKFEELNATVLTEKDYKNSRKIEQYVVERLEQMIEVTKEIEDEKTEYRLVTSYLNDVQLLEDMPEETDYRCSVKCRAAECGADGIPKFREEAVRRPVCADGAAGGRYAGRNSPLYGE